MIRAWFSNIFCPCSKCRSLFSIISFSFLSWSSNFWRRKKLFMLFKAYVPIYLITHIWNSRITGIYCSHLYTVYCMSHNKWNAWIFWQMYIRRYSSGWCRSIYIIYSFMYLNNLLGFFHCNCNCQKRKQQESAFLIAHYESKTKYLKKKVLYVSLSNDYV